MNAASWVKAGIDAAPGAVVARRHDIDQVALEPADRPAGRQPIDLGRVDAGVDRARHQGHAARLCRVVVLGHDRDRRQHRDAGLAHRDDMRAGAHDFEKRDDVVDEVVETETAVAQADVARIVPIGDVDVVLGQHRAHGAAQQGREMARHRRHQQHPRLRRLHVLFKAQQGAERRAVDLDLAHRDRPVGDLDMVDAKGRAAMAQPGAGDQLTEGGDGALHCVAGNSGQRVRQAPRQPYWPARATARPCRHRFESSGKSSRAIRSPAKPRRLVDWTRDCEMVWREIAGVGQSVARHVYAMPWKGARRWPRPY